LKPNANPVKRIPYRLNPKYKDKVDAEIDWMLEVGVVELVVESECISPMVVQDKKTRVIKVWVDLRNLNGACLLDPFPTTFTDEVLENVGGQDAYSFMDRLLVYHQIRLHRKTNIRLPLWQSGEATHTQWCILGWRMHWQFSWE
jgi:hypothetical protein